jgi:hypothetical protein
VRTGVIKGTVSLELFKEETPEGSSIDYPKIWEPIAQMSVIDGDSGGPVWRCGTGNAIGQVSASNDRGLVGIAPLVSPERPDQTPWQEEYFPFTRDQAPGILNAPEMGDIHLAIAK